MSAPTFADIYDPVVGSDFQDLWWAAFERAMTEHDIRFGSVCDVACGTGETLSKLARMGVRAHGIDSSADMIRVATAKCEGRGATFQVGSMQDLALTQPVDLLLCAYDSLNMLASEDALFHTLRRFYDVLTPGGHVICDLATVRHLAEDWGSGEIRTRAGDIDNVWHTVWDADARRLTVHLTAAVPNGAGGRHHVNVRVMEHGFIKARIDDAIAAAGLTVLAVHDMIPWTPGDDDADRLFYILKRPPNPECDVIEQHPHGA
ncbi:MAG: class I SAM-dependent methyltransferase [Leptospirillia bacterium]